MKGVVSAGHELTVRAGMEILEKGGNAFDAAVAASFASFMTEAALTSPAGGGFFISHPSEKTGGGVRFYDFFTDVPGKGGSRSDDFSFFSVFIDFADVRQELHVGEGSAAVPGVMAGLTTVIDNHCSLTTDELAAPAVRYAKDGIELNRYQAYFNSLLSPILTLSRESLDIYAPGGELLKAGDTIKNPALGETLEHLASNGLDGFYTGKTAERIVEGFGQKGLITAEDLTSYRVIERSPLEISYRGRRIYTNPPPSAGGALIAFALKLLEAHDVGALVHNSAPALKLLYETMRVTDLARRESFDKNAHVEGMEKEFLSQENISAFAARITDQLPGNTTHISVIDEDGNAAGITTSTGIGCGYMVPGTGIMMNNMLGEEDLNPKGFHTEPAGVRLSSMMAPTIVMRGDEPEIVLGSGGSKRIRSAILQVIVNIIDHDLPVDEAVNRARAHFDGEEFHVEPGVEGAVLDTLGSEVDCLNRWKETNIYFGGVHTVRDEDGRLTGAGDHRRGGASSVAGT